MIRAQNIRKAFGDLEVVKGIDLEINKAEIVSIIGSSGAGKTTLLQILGTLMQADTGDLFFDDIQISKLSQKKLAKFRNEQIGFVFQFHHLLPEFTALENVCIPGYISQKSRRETEKKALELLDFLNIAERRDHKPAELSGGEQQRVAVARALINNPSVIFADEPSGNLDSVNKAELNQLFLQLRDTFEQTFVIVTHDQMLADTSDRVLTIKDGLIQSNA